ncbi:calcium-binding protein [Methylopila turkensis]|uniref:Uncharacterized protein n=1 Tax=Methylopila turkensis TaxID=1437816 RepID=A0A9W6JQ03_9HYPH|nr:calcium-binding protein [Methylopila turkensis]GLK79744.1 hypothetical protein GCM10008174_14850 [Methylopila turkensis]
MRYAYDAFSAGAFVTATGFLDVIRLPSGGFVVFTFTSAAGAIVPTVTTFGSDGEPTGDSATLTGAHSSHALIDVVMRPDGGFLAAFGISGAAYFRRYGPDGTLLQDKDGDTDIPVAPPVGASLASMETLSDGRVLAVFIQHSSGGSSIHRQMFSPDGVAVGAASVAVSGVAPAPGSLQSANAVALSNGGYLLEYVVNVSSNGQTRHVQAFAGDGSALGSPGAFERYSSSVTALSNGGFAVGYMEEVGSNDLLRVQLYGANGAVSGGPITVGLSVDNGYAHYQSLIELVAMPGGGFAVIKTSYDEERIVIQSFSAAGSATSAEVEISDPTGVDHRYPQATALSDGRIAVVWTSDVDDFSFPSAVGTRTNGVIISLPGVSDPYFTNGGDLMVGTSGGDTFFAFGTAFGAGDRVDAGGGSDTILVLDAGVLDAAAADLHSVETLQGSFGDDVIIVSQKVLDGVSTIDGNEGIDVLRVVDSVDLRPEVLSGIERIEAAGAGPIVVRVADAATATLVHAAPDQHVTVRAPSTTFDLQQRNALFANGVDVVHGANDILYYSDGSATAMLAEVRANTITANTQIQPVGATLASGGWVSVWSSMISGSYDVKMQLYGVDGAPVGGETLVHTATSGAQSQPAVAALAGGGFVVVYAGANTVHVRRFDADGVPLATQTTLFTASASSLIVEPSVTTLDNGSYVVAWQTTGYDGSGYGLALRMFAENGVALGSAVRINTTTFNDQAAASIAATEDGGFVAAWLTGSHLSAEVAFQRFSAAGARIGTETLASTTPFALGVPISAETPVALCALAGGGFVIGWSAPREHALREAVLRRFDADGQALGPEVVVNLQRQGDQTRVSLCALDDGGFVASWVSRTPDDPNYDHIFVQRFDASGAAVGEQFDTGRGVGASLVARPDGGFAVLVEMSDGVSTYRDIVVREFRALDHHVLTPGGDLVAGDGRATTIIGAPGDLGSQDQIDGGGGTDMLQLASSGRIDLTAPAMFANVERIVGASGDDIVVVSTARLADVEIIDGGEGTDTVETGDETLDLRGVTLLNVERVTSTRAVGTAYQVDSAATALLIDGGAGGWTEIDATSITLTEAQIANILANGVNLVRDASGAYGVVTPRPDVIAAVEGAPVVFNVFADNGFGPDLGGAGLEIAAVNGLPISVGETIWPVSDISHGGWLTYLGGGSFSFDLSVFDYTPAPGSGASNIVAHLGFYYTLAGGDTTSVRVDFTGADSNDFLLGASGVADTLRGGLYDDVYNIDESGDRVIERDGEGHDTVQSSVSFSLAGQFIEALHLLGDGAINGTGNALDNALHGNSNANTLLGLGGDDNLDGYLGADRLEGGEGSDSYFIRDSAARVIEANVAGYDTVHSSVSFSLAGQFIEALVLVGSSALNGTGNALDNAITGNDGANTLLGLGGADVLDGGSGADRMEGGEGSDTYYVDSTGDRVIEANVAGYDTVHSWVSFAFGSQHLERLYLNSGAGAISGTGNGLANAITGNESANTLLGLGGDDILDGGAGGDRMEGGEGSDTYYVDHSGDRVIEADVAGLDTVNSAVSFSLAGQFIEKLVLTGEAAINGTGNSQANTIIGNGAANTINGGGGADRMEGGAGDDVYVVDDLGDRVVEANVAGFDTVNSAVSFSLAGQFIEKLALTGTAAINGTGNSQANTLVGNAAANTLNGLAGDDRLDGGRGSDILTGGAGADVFVFSAALVGGEVDSITDFVVVDDTIELSRSTFAGLALGTLATGAFNAGTAATEADDRLVYHAATGRLFFDQDGLGGSAAVHFATLSPNLGGLSGLDFVVVG